MLKNSKNSIFRTHDQLLSVINKKIQSCYQHHHYYHNDLIYMCNKNDKKSRQLKKKENKKPNKTINKRKRGTSKRTYPKSNNKCIRTFDSIHNSTTKVEVNSLSNFCFCECEYRVNFKVFCQIDNYLKNISVYFEENLISLQLVLVIIVFALITCTAQNIDSQVKSQQKPFASQTFFITSFNDPAQPTYINFNNSLHAIYCLNKIPNDFPLRSFKIQAKFVGTLRQSRYYLCSKDHTRHMEAIFRKISVLLDHVQSNPEKTLNTTNYLLPSNIYIGEDDNYDDFGNNNDSAIIIIKTQQNTSNHTIIRVGNNIAKDDQQKHQLQIQNLNVKTYLKNLTNKYYNNSVSNKTKKRYNKSAKKTTTKVGKVNNYASRNLYALHKHDDEFKLKNSQMELKSLTSSNLPRQPVNVHEQVDPVKLMNLVLDGLGLKYLPNVSKMNISQLEYVTKYRAYLQRAHLRKRRDLADENDNSSLRPLEILSIVTQSSSVIQNRVLKRQKRNSFESSHDNIEYNYQNPLAENDKKQSLEERVRNILFLKKKHQKPRSTKKERESRKSNIRLMFALQPEFSNLTSYDIEEANIRLILIHSPILAVKKSRNMKLPTKPKGKPCGSNKSAAQKNQTNKTVLNMKLYFLHPRGKKVLLDGRKIDIKVDQTMPEETHTRWLQFDATTAVKTAIDEKHLNHVTFELQCDNCKRNGVRILNEAYNTADDALAHQNSTDDHQLMPVLNIIGHFEKSQRSVRPHQYETKNSESEAETKHRHYHHQTHNNNNENFRTNCHKPNQRCCRHSMEVVFKEIKGFEFIIQPKVFDAGYCHGRCPPRYNPAHHHALLQSLIWKQNHRKAPRPCCAPSKLIELEVLHVDEKDSNKLKISTWSDMKVVECGCS